jgi:hypothetical protein
LSIFKYDIIYQLINAIATNNKQAKCLVIFTVSGLIL